jgi:hypothetical protein
MQPTTSDKTAKLLQITADHLTLASKFVDDAMVAQLLLLIWVLEGQGHATDVCVQEVADLLDREAAHTTAQWRQSIMNAVKAALTTGGQADDAA